MIELPETPHAPLLRVDFTDDHSWLEVRKQLEDDGFSGSAYSPRLTFVDRPDLGAMGSDELLFQIPRNYPVSYPHPFLLVADVVTMTTPASLLLVVDLSSDETCESFRAEASEIGQIEANLTESNLDFRELAEFHSRDVRVEASNHGDTGTARLPFTDETPREALQFVEEITQSRGADLPTDWPPVTGLPNRVRQGRDWVQPEVWVVTLTGKNARPGGVRVAGLFATRREAFLFQQAITDTDNLGHTEVIQVEWGISEHNF